MRPYRLLNGSEVIAVKVKGKKNTFKIKDKTDFLTNEMEAKEEDLESDGYPPYRIIIGWLNELMPVEFRFSDESLNYNP
jgi:hypothetical protein